MKCCNTWSYHPYRPLLREVGNIYISRTVPYKDKIHFEWLPTDDTTYSVFYKKSEDEGFVHYSDTIDTFCDIEGLSPETDYAFYVSAKSGKSRVRLARCGESVGTVVNYLHPDDEAYAFSGRYLCSPSLVRHPDGYLLSSMDVYAGGHPQNLTLIFRSDDEGESWHYVSELMPCFWGKMFIHRGELYMLSCDTEYGDLQIGKSIDGGKSFSAPVTLLRGANGKNGTPGVHKNPQNVVHYNGRIYETLEWGTWENKDYRFAAIVMSCDENDDLLVPENWHFTEPRTFDRFCPELDVLPLDSVHIEGTLAVAPDGRLLNVMRFHGLYHKVLVYEVDLEDPDAMLRFSHLANFPANFTKFMIKRDDKTGYYYSIGTRVYSPEKTGVRNLLSLLRSRDLMSWEIVYDILDYRNIDDKHIGFQYVDFEIEENDIIFLCRTSFNGANNYHDSNYQTFHRIKNFRNITQ
ncbi:MAG: hypothetical protein E7617_03820 [Ruminococcaceae bacterium]|nr:hypothetical protein [Oscillospiraceae bacterium]